MDGSFLNLGTFGGVYVELLVSCDIPAEFLAFTPTVIVWEVSSSGRFN